MSLIGLNYLQVKESFEKLPGFSGASWIQLKIILLISKPSEIIWITDYLTNLKEIPRIIMETIQ